MKPLLFAAACLASVPFVIGLASAATVVWYERCYLPLIAGED